MTKKFKAKEFRPGLWYVVNISNNVPIHNNEKFGNDKPLIFDEDSALEAVCELNKTELDSLVN